MVSVMLNGFGHIDHLQFDSKAVASAGKPVFPVALAGRLRKLVSHTLLLSPNATDNSILVVVVSSAATVSFSTLC